MPNIVITVSDEKGFEVDLKVSDEAIISETINHIAEIYSLKFKEENLIQAEPNGKILVKSKSFREQEVSHGALLTIV